MFPELDTGYEQGTRFKMLGKQMLIECIAQWDDFLVLLSLLLTYGPCVLVIICGSTSSLVLLGAP